MIDLYNNKAQQQAMINEFVPYINNCAMNANIEVHAPFKLIGKC